MCAFARYNGQESAVFCRRSALQMPETWCSLPASHSSRGFRSCAHNPATILRRWECGESRLWQAAMRMRSPATVELLSTAPEIQSAPPDTLRPAGPRTYQQAIDLLQKEIDRTASKWEAPISSAQPSAVAAHAGEGFFTDGNNQTG